MSADWGLSIETLRTNVVTQSDSWTATWTPGLMTVTPAQPDPAGGTAATLFHSSGNQPSNYFQCGGGAISAWLHGVGTPGDPEPPGGPLAYAHFRHKDKDTWLDVIGTTWARYSIKNNGNEYGAIVLETRDSPPGAGAILGPTEVAAYAGQVEPN